MVFLRTALWAAAVPPTLASLVHPPGTPYPDTTYPDAVDQYAISGSKFNQTSPPSYPSPWGTGMGDWAEAYEKARSFVSQLTLTEKVNLTTGVGWEMEKCVGNVGSIPRLAFQALCLQDSPLGVRDTDFNSAFSAGITVAATWDRNLFYQRGFDMGSEHRDKGTDMQLGPVVGPLGRTPLAGRNWEGFSPDPVLSGVAVAYTVQGIQAAGVMASTKHFIGYEQEHFREGAPPNRLTTGYSSNIDDTTMHELYLWPFADAVRAGTASIMSSYNQINNSHASQNAWTLNYLLKNELGFQGFVVTDWSGQHSGVSCALAGGDMTMPGDVEFDTGTSYWGANLTVAVLNGTVPQWRIDDMATRIMASYYYVDRPGNMVPNAPTFSSWTTDTYGYEHFWPSEGYQQINYHVNVQQDHYKGIREVAAKGTVLLKNNGALPLTGNEQLVAIFGSDAGENLWGPNGDPDRGGDNGTLAMGWGSGTANYPYLITPLEAIKAEVRAHNGNIEDVIDDYAYEQANALARRAGQPMDGDGGVCIVFGNADSGEEYIIVDNNVGDRNNFTLWHNTNDMIKNVTSQCSNTIIVMHSTGAIIVDEWYDHPNVTAILWAGLPGQESGNAITDILYGKVNPGGKTPFSWGSSRKSFGTSVLYELNNGVLGPQLDFEEGPFIDYRLFDELGEAPIYEFGFGLSYTNFSFSNLQVQSLPIPAYIPTTGNTPAAQTYGNISTDASEYVCPDDLHRVYNYLYPCLNSTNLKKSSGDPEYGVHFDFPAHSSDGSPQPYLRAGSSTSPGGNEGLYDVLFTVTADVTNTGAIVGDEVPQLYISLGGPNVPKVQLRGFDRITIEPGQTEQFVVNVTRRDVSNWNTDIQDWVITQYPKTVYVGNSSRNLPLSANLTFGPAAYSTGSSNGTTPSTMSSVYTASSFPSATLSGSAMSASSATSASAVSSAASSATTASAVSSETGSWPSPPAYPTTWSS